MRMGNEKANKELCVKKETNFMGAFLYGRDTVSWYE